MNTILRSIINLRNQECNIITKHNARRSASVAIIIRLNNQSSSSFQVHKDDINLTNGLSSSSTSKHNHHFECKCNCQDNKHSQQCIESFVNGYIDLNESTHDVQTEILYAKKSQRGRRKGEVCFPGGHLEKGESPQVTDGAERETMEEVGLNLKDGTKFSYIGRLDDRITFDNLALHSFVYLQVSDKTPPIEFSDKELDDCGWVNIDYFINNPNPKEEFNNHILTYQSLGSMSSRRLSNPILKKLLGSFQVPIVELPIPTSKFRLWGLTLELTSELISKLNNGHTPIPTMRQSNNVFIYHFLTHPKQSLATLLATTIILPYIYFVHIKNGSL